MAADIRDKKGYMRDEEGYIVVETVGAFVPFLLLVISILSLVNIIAVQARIHYALTQAANTLSVYSYTLEILGVANDLTSLSNKAERPADMVEKIKGDIDSVLKVISETASTGGAAGGGGEAGNQPLGLGENLFGDPQDMLKGLMNYGANEVKNKALEVIARPLVGRYLANGMLTGHDYLLSAGVINTKTGEIGLGALDFYKFTNFGQGGSEFLDKDGKIRLTVEYEILYTFWGLPLPFSPTLKVTQTVVTKAWLNGSGRCYQ